MAVAGGVCPDIAKGTLPVRFQGLDAGGGLESKA